MDPEADPSERFHSALRRAEETALPQKGEGDNCYWMNRKEEFDQAAYRASLRVPLPPDMDENDVSQEVAIKFMKANPDPSGPSSPTSSWNKSLLNTVAKQRAIDADRRSKSQKRVRPDDCVSWEEKHVGRSEENADDVDVAENDLLKSENADLLYQADPERLLLEQVDREELKQALERLGLSPTAIEVVLLRAVDDYTAEETASVVEKTPGNVHTIYCRAIERLQRLWGKMVK